jgi:hypothetical protein
MLVFQGLWTQCDSKGKFLCDADQLKLDILPFISFDMRASLDDLAAASFIDRYMVDGKEYGRIKSFLTHQRITGKEKKDGERFPDPNQTKKRSARETPGKQSGNTWERLGAQELELGNGKDNPYPFSDSWFGNPEFKKAWDGWIAGRKKKPTSRALELSLSKLREISGGDEAAAISVLNQSAAYGWTGLFPLKEPGRNSRPSVAAGLQPDFVPTRFP